MPLAIGLALVGLFVVLLIRYRQPEGIAVSSPPPPPPAKIEKEPAPPTSLTPNLEEVQRPMYPPPGPGLQRWALDHLPEGWDPVIADQIANYFEAIAVRNPTDPKVLNALYLAREAIEKYLAGLGPEAIPTLSAILGAEPDFANRRFLLYALGNLGPRSEEATYALVDFYQRNRDIVEARSEMSHLIEAMGRLKNDTSYQLINKQLDDDFTPETLKDKFIQALGKHPRAGESMNKFVEYMDYEESAQIRNHSAQALGIIRDSKSLDYLILRYKRETFVPVRQTILGSIGKIGSESSIAFLDGEARNAPEEDIRLSASRAIWLIGTPKALKALLSVQKDERSEMIREKIQKWIDESPAPKGR